MQDALILIARKQHGLFRCGKDSDGGCLLSLLILLRRGGVIHIKSLGIGNGQDFHETQFRDVGYRLQHVVVIMVVEADKIRNLLPPESEGVVLNPVGVNVQFKIRKRPDN